MFLKIWNRKESRLLAENEQLKQELVDLRKWVEQKKSEEAAEMERLKKMRNFWCYDGTPQEGVDEK